MAYTPPRLSMDPPCDQEWRKEMELTASEAEAEANRLFPPLEWDEAVDLELRQQENQLEADLEQAELEAALSD